MRLAFMDPGGSDYLASSCRLTDDFVALDATSDWNNACHFRSGAGHSEEVTIGTDAGRG